jgi:hypothetical protein
LGNKVGLKFWFILEVFNVSYLLAALAGPNLYIAVLENLEEEKH